MLTLSIVIEDRDDHGDLTEYHKYEVRETADLLGMCYYLIRHVDDNGIVGAASRLMDEYVSYDDFRLALSMIAGERARAEERSRRCHSGANAPKDGAISR